MALAAQAVAAAPKAVLHPPASPFAELLRRSKFASYDPAIRQTYQAAPSSAHRGDWGVKRPLSLRRKNAFISLTSFEHHAHFTEWNHAENQVRFVRRVEEMGGNVEAKISTSWYKALGMAEGNPLFDSEFCPEEPTNIILRPLEKETTVNLDSLGKRGPGAYGTQRRDPPKVQEVFVTRNINAMPKRQFKRYIRSLRALRPEFKDFVTAQSQIKEKNLYALSMSGDKLPYRRFLQAQMQKGYDDYAGLKIEPQPHPNAALNYARPTKMESYLWTKPKPGFILNIDSDPYNNHPSNPKKGFVASFGGITASIGIEAAAGKAVLLDASTEEGVNQERIEDSILQMRLDPRHSLKVETPPIAVGNRPQGLKAVKITATVMKDDEHLGWDNPHPVGSAEYVAMAPASKKFALSSFRPRTSSKDSSPTFSGDPNVNLISTLRDLSSRTGRGSAEKL
ncbi:hypothetical protein H0H87_010822 [Tephrocybe sp. NHM501043]|nr:hypothetical protein H0H87_010822 [Tephrocybe sp. NHM501043]